MANRSAKARYEHIRSPQGNVTRTSTKQDDTDVNTDVIESFD
jgi:hypothetical protein